jgi:predicted metal-dependent phosphoesterase TrpH
MEARLVNVDFHCHTRYSIDSLTRPENLIKSAHKRGLDHVVITDHNTIAGAIAAQTLDPDLIIVGEEIMTRSGEILGAYMTEEIAPGLTAKETVKRLWDQGAFISISHPFDSYRSGAWEREDLLEIASLVDAIEIFNARSLKMRSNRLAREFAGQQQLAGTVGSDAHSTGEIGAAWLQLPSFSNADSLREVIGQGIVQGHLSPFWVHFFSRFAHLYKKVV